MQRDHYRPLKVIGEHISSMDRGLQPPAIEDVGPRVPSVSLATDGMPSVESFRSTSDLRVSRRELLKVVGIEVDLLAQLETFGLGTASRSGHFDADDLVIAKAACDLAAFGLEPRHLRTFRTAADREVGLVEQVVAHVRGGRAASARARAEEAVAAIRSEERRVGKECVST